MYKCGTYVKPETDDCSYKDDRCCYYCDKKWDCKAIVKWGFTRKIGGSKNVGYYRNC